MPMLCFLALSCPVLATIVGVGTTAVSPGQLPSSQQHQQRQQRQQSLQQSSPALAARGTKSMFGSSNVDGSRGKQPAVSSQELCPALVLIAGV